MSAAPVMQRWDMQYYLCTSTWMTKSNALTLSIPDMHFSPLLPSPPTPPALPLPSHSPTSSPSLQVSRHFDLRSGMTDLECGGLTVLKPVGPVRIQFNEVAS